MQLSNHLSQWRPSGSIGAHNQLKTLASASDSGASNFTYSYDAEGNVITRSKPGEFVSYTYDHRNRLTRAVYSTQAFAAPTKEYTFTYDALDRRIMKTATGPAGKAEQSFAYDGQNLLLMYDGNQEQKRCQEPNTVLVPDTFSLPLFFALEQREDRRELA